MWLSEFKSIISQYFSEHPFLGALGVISTRQPALAPNRFAITHWFYSPFYPQYAPETEYTRFHGELFELSPSKVWKD